VYDLILRDATIVDAGTRRVADIAIEGGKIVDVGGSISGGAREEIAAIGRFVMPGVIDSHVHFRDPGMTHKEDWASGSRAAVARGVTTVLDMPNTIPATTDEAAVRAKLAIAGARSVACHGVWAGATSGNVDQLSDLHDQGLVCGIKVFMGDSTGALAVDDDTLEAVFQRTRGLIGVHAEDQKLLAKAHKKWGALTDPVHNDVRPPKVAVEAVRRLIELVRATGRQVHICHLSTAAELNLLDPLRGDLPITTEVCPHHLYLSVETSAEQGQFVKVNPPVRTEMDRRALWAAVKRGRIDTFASDHAPHTSAEKLAPYWDAPSGVPGVEVLWPLLITAVKHGRVGLEQLVAMSTEAPARIFGLEGKGRITVGYDADLILFTEGETTRFAPKDVLSKAGWSPYIGREVGVPPELVVVAGRVAARAGRVVDDLPPAPPVRYIGRG
jgi:dihydroorotase